MEYELVSFVRNKIRCRLFLLVAVFIVVKFLNLQNRHWQGRNGKSYTNSIFGVWCELIACHMKKILIVIIIITGLQILKQTKYYLTDTKQSWISTEVTCNMLVYSCTNSQANPVSAEFDVWSPTDPTVKVNELSIRNHMSNTQENSSAVYNVIWTKSFTDYGYSKRDTNVFWRHVAFLLRFFFYALEKHDWNKQKY